MGAEDQDRDRQELDALKAAVSLPDVIRQLGVELRPAGQNWVGRCPFHKDGKASFTVNPQAPHGGLWNCFGCKKGGDVLRFLEMKENLTFPEAVARLRSLAGTPEPSTGISVPPKRNGVSAPLNGETRADIFAGGHTRPHLLRRVADWYAKTLPKNRGAQAYLESRGLSDPQLWTAFGLGFADGSLFSSLPESGELRDALVELGVITAKGREHFLGCVVTPLFDADDNVLGLYGRRIQAEAEIKHLFLKKRQRGVLNPPSYKSGEPLYLAESIFDALSIWSVGHHNVSALYGAKNLPPDVETMLATGGVREVRFCLDADAVGRAATEELSVTLAARGITCATVRLPEGHDPNSLLTGSGPAALRAALDHLTPLALPPPLTDQPEPTEDGFILRLGDLTYRVAPRKPGSHGVQAFLKVSGYGDTVMDTVNLHAQRSRAALTNQLSARMGADKLEVERHLQVILEHVEAWHAAGRKKESTETTVLETKRAPEMTEAEQAVGKELLLRPDLLDAILADMEALGFVGEEDNKLLAYLIGSSRKREKPLSGIVLSQSAAGKSSLTELVEILTPPEDVVLYSRITPQALVFMPKDYIKHKLLIIEERIGGEAADYSIRTLQTKKRFVQAMPMKDPQSGQMRTQEKEVEGPIAYLETTTNPRINAENASRCFEISARRIRGADPPHPGAAAAFSQLGNAGTAPPGGIHQDSPSRCPAPSRTHGRYHPVRARVALSKPLASDAARQRAFPLPHRGGGLAASASTALGSASRR